MPVSWARGFRLYPPHSCSLDYLVGAAEESERDSHPQSPRRLQVDDQLDFGDLLHRQVGRLLALKNPSSVDPGQTVGLDRGTVGYQTARRDEWTVLKNRRECVRECECGELFTLTDEQCVGDDHE